MRQACTTASVADANTPAHPLSRDVPTTPKRVRHSAPAGTSYLDRFSTSTLGLLRTPIKATTASHRRAVETHHAIDAHLTDELRGSMEYDVPLNDFIDNLLMPTDNSRRMRLVAIIERVEQSLLKHSKQLSDESAPQVSHDFLKHCWLVDNEEVLGYSERTFLPYFCKLFEGMAALGRQEGKRDLGLGHEELRQPDRVFLENRVRYLKAAEDGPQAKRKLYWYVCDRNNAHLRWDAVQINAEMKQRESETDDKLWKLDLQMAGYAREIFHAQPDRTHVHGLCVRNATIWLYRWDRLGGLVSEPFNFQQNWIAMLRVVLGYIYMDAVDLGHGPEYQQKSLSPQQCFQQPENIPASMCSVASSCALGSATSTSSPSDPELDTSIPPLPSPSTSQSTNQDTEAPMELSNTPEPGLYSMRICEKDYVLKRVLDRHKSLVGRATACWEAESIDGVEFVVKTAWPQTTQVPEDYFYRLARDRGVRGLMDLVDFSTRGAATVRKARRGTKGLLDNSDLNTTAVKRKQSSSAVPEFTAPPIAKQRRVSKSEKLAPAGRRPSESETTASQAEPDAPQISRPQIDRTFVALAFRKAIGTPLSSVASPTHILKAVKSALEVHRLLYMQAGIIHSDVSVFNILATLPGTRLSGDNGNEDGNSAPRPHGFLVDFDYSITKQQQVTGASHRTGTLLFLAVSVLKNHLNTYRSDLESFFYVLCYVCTHFPVEEEKALSHGLATTVKKNVWAYDQDSSDSFTAPRRYDIEAHGPLANWVLGDQTSITGLKSISMIDEDHFQNAVLDHVTPTFAPAKSMLENLRAVVVRSKWFMATERRKRLHKACEEQRSWIARGKPPSIRDPLIEENEKILDEEDGEAHELYNEMVKEIDDVVEKWI